MARIVLAIAVWLLFILVIEVGFGRPTKTMDLGIARYPGTTHGLDATIHEWSADSIHRRYRLGYVHGASAKKSLTKKHERIGAWFQYSKLDGDQIQLG